MANTKPKTAPAKPVAEEKKVEKPVEKRNVKIKMNATYCGDYGVFYYGQIYTVDSAVAELFIKNKEAEEIKD